jgi:hypothetical protein
VRFHAEKFIHIRLGTSEQIKFKMKKLILLMLAGGLFIFNSCTKTGPMGPQGPAGPPGAPGPQGPTGNANVYASEAFVVSGWNPSGNTWKKTVNAPEITSDISEFGSVEVFKLYGADEWTNLPDINGNTSTVFNFYPGGFTLLVQTFDGSVPANPGSLTFRFIVISSALRQAHPNTNWKNYKEAMAAINAGAQTEHK